MNFSDMQVALAIDKYLKHIVYFKHKVVLGSYHFYCEGGSLFVGGNNFLGLSDGGAELFSLGQKVGPNFFAPSAQYHTIQNI